MISRFRSAAVRAPLLGLVLIALIRRLAIAVDSVPQRKLAVLELDPAKTTIAYSLEGWPHHTQGTFALKRAVIRLDPQTGKMDGIIIVDAASGNSGNSVRDERMKSSVLEVNRFPDISFAPQQVVSHGSVQGEFPVTVRGLMLLHGAQHDFTIKALVRRDGNNVTIHCYFAIPFVKWGLQDPSILMFKVSKEVNIAVTIDAHLSWIAATAMPTAVYPLRGDVKRLASRDN
jgi:polyisoprenoid-binding protein YceI